MGFVLSFPSTPVQAQDVTLSGNIPASRVIDATAERLGLTIQYSPNDLTERVTIRSNTPMTGEELWLQMNESLKRLGHTTIRLPAPGSYEVVPVEEAASGASIVQESDRTGGFPPPGFNSVLFAVAPLDAAEAVALVTPVLTPSTGSAKALPGSGEVLITDFTSRIEVAASVLERVRTAEERVVIETISAPRGRAVEFAASVKLLADRQQAAGGPLMSGDVVVAADGASVTVVSPEREIDLWRSLAERALPSKTNAKRYALQGFDSATLAAIFEDAVASQLPSAAEGTLYFANTFTGSVTVRGDKSVHDILDDLVTELRDMPASARVITSRVPIKHRVAQELAEQLLGLLEDDRIEVATNRREASSDPEDIADAATETLTQDRPPSAPISPSSPVGTRATVSIDERTNSLLITGTPAEIDAIRSLAFDLDTPISQVMLEVLLVSLTESETLDLGVELDKIEVGGGTLYRLSSLFGFGADASAATLPDGGAGFTGAVLDPGEFSVLVRALETVNEGRSLSMPRVLVANGEEAEFNSVTQQPILATNASDVVATTSFGGFEDAGTTISVAPQILAGDQLNLDYAVTLSAFIGESSSPALPPPRQQNQLASAITIPDSHTIAVGGIELDSFGDAESRLPLIGSVPWVGELFKNRSRSRSKTKFYVFIRASIYKDELFEQLRYVSKDLAEEYDVPTGWPVVEPRIIR